MNNFKHRFILYLEGKGYRVQLSDECFAYYFNSKVNHLIRVPRSLHAMNKEELVRIFVGKSFDLTHLDVFRKELIEMEFLE